MKLSEVCAILYSHLSLPLSPKCVYQNYARLVLRYLVQKYNRVKAGSVGVLGPKLETLNVSNQQQQFRSLNMF